MITEVALACVLLIGSGLLIRSFLRVLEVDLGFRPENAIAFRIDPELNGILVSFATATSPNRCDSQMMHRVWKLPVLLTTCRSDVIEAGVFARSAWCMRETVHRTPLCGWRVMDTSARWA